MLSLLRRIVAWLCFWRKTEEVKVPIVTEEVWTPTVEKAVYVITKKEQANGMLNTNRKPDSGDRFSIASLTDEEFLTNVSVYHDGILQMNDRTVDNVSQINNDCARWASKPSCLIFVSKLREGAIIQIVR